MAESTTAPAEALINRFTDWATGRDDIRAAMLVGSRARIDRPADEWSDIDLVIFTTDVAAYLDGGDWVTAMGPVILSFTESTLGGLVERRVLYRSGLQADYPILPTTMLDLTGNGEAQQSSAAFRAQIADILSRGFQVLIDKDGRLTGLAAIAGETPRSRPPDAAAFANTVNDFWFHALWTARKLRRGEYLVAKSCCDGSLKGDLVDVARWHAAAGGGEIWHQSRFFERWADPRLIAELPASAARYDPDDIARALRATMRTFDWLARETADRLGFAYPEDAAHWITVQVDATLDTAPGT